MTEGRGHALARHWPAAAAIGLLGAAIAVLLARSLSLCEGRLVYPLDDTYIHMAVARNLLRHGVWGVSRFNFSSAVSSLLWPLLLAFSWLGAGVRDWVPLALNFVFAALLLAWVARLHAAAGHRPWFVFLSLIVIAFLTPLPGIAMLGMEHVLHALLAVVFAGVAARLLAGERSDLRAALPLLLLAPLVGMVRYEVVYLLGAGCFLFACRGRWRQAVALGAAGMAPLVVFGCVSVLMGWHFFPNSVLIKAGLLGTAVNIQPVTLNIAIGRMIDTRQLVIPFALALAAFALRLQGRRDIWEPGIIFCVLYFLTFIPSYATGQQSLFSRYDAWFTCFGLAAFMLNLPGAAAALRRRSVIVMAVLVLLGLPVLTPMMRNFIQRAIYCMALPPPASRNIYEQQYQMGRFLARYYGGRGVAANDIGAVNYYGDIDCLDLFGLAGMEIPEARRRDGLTSATLAGIAARRGIGIAVCYQDWVGAALPGAWRKAGAWQLSDNHICGGPEVTFYATKPEEFPNLKKNLKEFGATLPKRVGQVVVDK